MFSKLTRVRTAALVFALGLALAACGGGDSVRDDAVDRIVEEGMSQDVAECIVDGTADAFGEEALAADYEGTPEELDEVFEIMDSCLFGS